MIQVSDMAALRAIAEEESTDEETPQKDFGSKEYSIGDSAGEGTDSDEANEPLLELIKLPAGVFVFSVKGVTQGHFKNLVLQ